MEELKEKILQFILRLLLTQDFSLFRFAKMAL
jgi:hypothetical protein